MKILKSTKHKTNPKSAKKQIKNVVYRTLAMIAAVVTMVAVVIAI